ncbi:conserved hypothetical protein [Perkinsus marinus ATCC 50983]|uniref:Uncharacterized protein n=1 Tax=Perkinsus marinus (strain ATCC 50983 / TXsc) TaxID=423536 RepID=C5L2F3_PERM5|nr:conserved hypothetical protein [Perkinsus marinus ATCC 50983]EER09047.1 conserved hypothetical protein [Perkinsus marinus ATCC 50983]|eukprot:XP_002777231.1 conserved hypothetical protein [Perkinsus marinus ATCC 50983]
MFGGGDLGGFGGYGGFGGFGASQGGGFGGGGAGMTQKSVVGGFGPVSPSTGRSKSDPSARESMGLIPVTAAMVINAFKEMEVGEANFKFHGKEAFMIEIVGAVIDVQRRADK